MQIAFESGKSDSVIVCLSKIHFIKASTNPQMNRTITLSDFDGNRTFYDVQSFCKDFEREKIMIKTEY